MKKILVFFWLRISIPQHVTSSYPEWKYRDASVLSAQLYCDFWLHSEVSFLTRYGRLIIPSQQRWRGYSNAAVRVWLGEWVGSWVRGSVQLYLVDTIATTVFGQSLSNFTCTFTMMRGGTLLILGHGVKGQGQLWHSVYNTLWTQ